MQLSRNSKQHDRFPIKKRLFVGIRLQSTPGTHRNKPFGISLSSKKWFRIASKATNSPSNRIDSSTLTRITGQQPSKAKIKITKSKLEEEKSITQTASAQTKCPISQTGSSQDRAREYQTRLATTSHHLKC